MVFKCMLLCERGLPSYEVEKSPKGQHFTFFSNDMDISDEKRCQKLVVALDFPNQGGAGRVESITAEMQRSYITRTKDWSFKTIL